MEEKPRIIHNMAEFKGSPENDGVILYLMYDNGCRSVKRFNEKLSDHYHRAVKMTADEICKLLRIKSQEHAGKFNEKEIVD